MSGWLKLNPISMVPILMINQWRVASCIMVPDPLFRMALFCQFFCWSHISDYQTVLNMCNLKCWQLTSLHYMDALSWRAIFHLVINENDFSVPFERHTLLKSHDVILHASFYWQHKCHYDRLEHVIVMITWRWNADAWKKTISGLNYIA